jgi:hypothetical protein
MDEALRILEANGLGFAEDVQQKLRNAISTALLANAAGGGEPVLQVKQSYGASLWANVSQAEFDACTTEKRRLYTATPPPVGAPQGVSDEEVQKALRDYGWFVTAENEANMRRALESFAASRPVAVGVSAERAALRTIADMHPHQESSVHGPRMRCNHCQYAWMPAEVESHSTACAYVIAHQALTASTTKAGGAS